MTGIKKFLLWLLGILIVSLPVISPLTKPGFFPTHDGEWAVVRLAEMNRELKDLQIPPRWSDFLNHGYGYPLFLFTYPFPYYLGEVFHVLGFGLVNSIKLLFLLSVLLSGVFMFLLGYELEGEVAGFIAAALYIYAPFRLVDIYVRGSLGESLSFALFPLLFWLSLRLIQEPNLLKLVLTSTVLAILILTHNVMALIFTPIWLIFSLVAVKYYYEDINKYLFRWLVPILVLGLGLSSYFWLPALWEKKFIYLSQSPLSNLTTNFINPMEFFNSPWNYGVRPSFQLGWIHILIFILGILTLLLEKGMDRKKNLFLGFYILVSAFVLMILTLPISYPFWKLPLLSTIDFPWRLMAPITFFLSLGVMFATKRKWVRYFVYAFIVLSFFLIPNFAKPQEYFQKEDDYYRNIDATTTSADELMPIWVNDKPKNKYQNKVEVETGRADISAIDFNSKHIAFVLNALTPARLRINSIYFPGWEYTLDGNKTNIEYINSKGLVTVDLPVGTHRIAGTFGATTVRKWADIITIGSLAITLVILIVQFSPRLRIKLL